MHPVHWIQGGLLTSTWEQGNYGCSLVPCLEKADCHTESERAYGMPNANVLHTNVTGTFEILVSEIMEAMNPK